MNKFFYYAFLLVFLSCNSTQSQEAKETILVPSEQVYPVRVVKADSPAVTDSSMNDTESSYLEETATYYIVIGDTRGSYGELRDKMFSMHGSFKIPIDTMGRSYDESKNLIALPENDEDDLFAVDYYPRRFPSATLSLEYLGLYQRKATEKTMALVTGIYENKSSADSAVSIFKQIEPKAFVVKTNMYIGCIH